MKARINKVKKISLTLDSSNLDSLRYYLKTKNMVVDFKNGSKYKYLGVPNVMIFRMLSSESKGKFFNRNIRTAFRFQRIK